MSYRSNPCSQFPGNPGETGGTGGCGTSDCKTGGTGGCGTKTGSFSG